MLTAGRCCRNAGNMLTAGRCCWTAGNVFTSGRQCWTAGSWTPGSGRSSLSWRLPFTSWRERRATSASPRTQASSTSSTPRTSSSGTSRVSHAQHNKSEGAESTCGEGAESSQSLAYRCLVFAVLKSFLRLQLNFQVPLIVTHRELRT